MSNKKTTKPKLFQVNCTISHAPVRGNKVNNLIFILYITAKDKKTVEQYIHGEVLSNVRKENLNINPDDIYVKKLSIIELKYNAIIVLNRDKKTPLPKLFQVYFNITHPPIKGFRVKGVICTYYLLTEDKTSVERYIHGEVLTEIREKNKDNNPDNLYVKKLTVTGLRYDAIINLMHNDNNQSN